MVIASNIYIFSNSTKKIYKNKSSQNGKQKDRKHLRHRTTNVQFHGIFIFFAKETKEIYDFYK